MIVDYSIINYPDGGMHPSRAEMARAILKYLVEHEGAADTLEGIARWWMLQEDVKRTLKNVQDCLDEFVIQGLLKHRGLPGSSDRLYYIERGAIARVTRILTEYRSDP